ncbi:MAG TPA: hypothetical protein VMN35_00070 [Gaiellaceae bacterium]|nr:hypothetical protein [Gaiellaceae bacterium]
MSRHRLVFLTALSLGAALAALTGLSAHAGPPGTWTRVTDPNGRNIDQVGVARAGNGVLHVFWMRRDGPLEESLRRTPVSPAGKVSGSSVVLGGLTSISDPDAVMLPDGRLRVFFAGLGDTSGAAGVMAATGSAAGTGWKREGIRVSSIRSALGSVGAAVTAQGESVVSYTRSFVAAFKVGLDPNVPDTEIQPDKKCCDYVADLATDAKTGRTMIAWYSNATGRKGTWVQQVLPSVGKRVLVPGSVSKGKAVGVDQRVAIAARKGAPGVYVAACQGYPVCTRTLLWKVGGKAIAVGKSADVEDVHLSAGPEGRLWVAWHDGRTKRIHAARTNKAATRVGPLLTVAPPKGTSSMWKLTGEGSLGALDLLVSATTGSSLATWHTQVVPPLSLRATKSQTQVTFSVTDAGDPVSGAKVSYGGKTVSTNAAGKATTTITPGKVTAKGTKPGYQPVSASVTG